MINKLLIFQSLFYAIMQGLDEAVDVLSIKEVTIIGVLLFFNILAVTAIIYLYKKVQELNNLRLEDHKEYTKEVLNITQKTADTVRQVNEILKLR